eukprot:scaffold2987_cov170-Amphora_coffeaeformis.AAC.23
MGQYKNQQGRSPTGFGQVWYGMDVGRQWNAGKILNIFVSLIDKMGYRKKKNIVVGAVARRSRVEDVSFRTDGAFWKEGAQVGQLIENDPDRRKPSSSRSRPDLGHTGQQNKYPQVFFLDGYDRLLAAPSLERSSCLPIVIHSEPKNDSGSEIRTGQRDFYRPGLWYGSSR